MAELKAVRDQAMAALVAGDLPGALALAKLSLYHFPADYQSLGLLGQIYLEGGRYDESRNAFEAVLRVDPENVLARQAMAAVEEKGGNLDEALEQLECACDIGGGSPRLVEEMRRVHSLLGSRWPLDPGSSRYARANRLLATGKYVEAIPLLKEAFRVAPRPEIAVGMAHALWVSGSSRDAEMVARELVAEHPDCLKALAILAAASAGRGELDPSLLVRTAALDPGNSAARAIFSEAGTAFPSTEEHTDIPDGEIEELRSTIERGMPPDRVAQRATTPESGLQPGGAEPSRVTLAPGGALHLSLGRFCESRGSTDLAIAEYRAALRLDPALAPEVASAARAIANAEPELVEARWLVGDALAAQGLLRGAVAEYLLVLRAGRPARPAVDGISESDTEKE